MADGHDGVMDRLSGHGARHGYGAGGVALVERGQGQRLAVGKEVGLEGVLRHAVELRRGADVGDQ